MWWWKGSVRHGRGVFGVSGRCGCECGVETKKRLMGLLFALFMECVLWLRRVVRMGNQQLIGACGVGGMGGGVGGGRGVVGVCGVAMTRYMAYAIAVVCGVVIVKGAFH